MIAMRRQLCLLPTFAGVLLPALAAAQTVTLEGRITSAGGLPITDAVVHAVEVETGEARTVTTRTTGDFRMLALSPGRYRVEAGAERYATRALIVDVVVGQRPFVHLELHAPAMTLAPVVVEAERTAALEITRSSISTAILEREIRELPLGTRNVMDLAALAPGIRSFRPLGGQGIPGAGPLRGERFINFYLDGVQLKNLYDGNLIGFPHLGSPLPADALREFRVYLHPYDPGYTHGASYVINAVSHRGTNRFESSAFGLLLPRGFVAGNAFLRQRPDFTSADFRRQQAGLTLRGPIVRDRLFYASSFELSNTVNYVSVVPPRPENDASRWDRYAGVFPAPNRNRTGLLRITWTPSGTHALDAIATLRGTETETLFGGDVAREGAVADENRLGTLNLRHRWLASDRGANEFSFQLVGWSNRGLALDPQPVHQHQGLRIGAPAPEFSIAERHIRLVNRSTLAFDGRRGSHLLDAGVELARVRISNFFPNLKFGRFDFEQRPSARIAVGARDPDSDADAFARSAGWVAGVWLGHEWRPGARLTLNFGLRYDAELGLLNNHLVAPWASDPELAALPELQPYLNRGNRRDDLDNVSPRLAASWDAIGNGSTTLRAGFGIVHDRVPSFIPFQEQRDAYWRTYVFQDPGTTDPEVLRRRVLDGEGRHTSFILLSNTLEVPQNRQWSVGLGRRLTPHLALNLDYVRQDVRKLFAGLNLNWLDFSGGEARRALSQNHGDINVWDDFARARYRALLTQLKWQPGPELRLNLAYTLGAAQAEWDVANQFVPAAAKARYYVMQRISGDERHRVVASGSVPLPYRGRLSFVTTLASPRPYLALAGTDLNGNNFRFDDWIDERRYRVPPGRWRNWYRVVDVRLAHDLPIGGARVSATAEALNIFNTQNYSSFDGTLNTGGGDNLRFGQPSGVFGTRQLQLGARLSF
jgi:hypothetical protein